MRQGTGIVIIKRIRRQIELRTLHLHIIVKHRHLGLRIIFPPVGSQRRVTVNHLAAFKEIGIVIQTVKVKAVRIERCLPVFQNHIITGSCNLFITVIIGVIADKGEGVALIHLHMTEGLKGIAGLIEIGTVAIESGSDMGEVHLSIKDGRIGILVLVEMEYIGMNQIDACVLHPRLTGRTLPGTVLLGTGSRHGQEKHKHQEIYSLFHLIQPSYSNLQSR